MSNPLPPNVTSKTLTVTLPEAEAQVLLLLLRTEAEKQDGPPVNLGTLVPDLDARRAYIHRVSAEKGIPGDFCLADEQGDPFLTVPRAEAAQHLANQIWLGMILAGIEDRSESEAEDE